MMDPATFLASNSSGILYSSDNSLFINLWKMHLGAAAQPFHQKGLSSMMLGGRAVVHTHTHMHKITQPPQLRGCRFWFIQTW